MKNNRRDFIKLAGMAGIGLTGAIIIPVYAEQVGIQSLGAGDKFFSTFRLIRMFSMLPYGAPLYH